MIPSEKICHYPIKLGDKATLIVFSTFLNKEINPKPGISPLVIMIIWVQLNKAELLEKITAEMFHSTL